uniref:E3 ubiquitin-protein ligase RNF220 middle domain-containing protein n=1 Tax=Schistocephalus solidus TaxID=70667 RepID=A0A0V0J3Z2_SCHSO
MMHKYELPPDTARHHHLPQFLKQNYFGIGSPTSSLESISTFLPNTASDLTKQGFQRYSGPQSVHSDSTSNSSGSSSSSDSSSGNMLPQTQQESPKDSESPKFNGQYCAPNPFLPPDICSTLDAASVASRPLTSTFPNLPMDSPLFQFGASSPSAVMARFVLAAYMSAASGTNPAVGRGLSAAAQTTPFKSLLQCTEPPSTQAPWFSSAGDFTHTPSTTSVFTTAATTAGLQVPANATGRFGTDGGPTSLETREDCIDHRNPTISCPVCNGTIYAKDLSTHVMQELETFKNESSAWHTGLTRAEHDPDRYVKANLFDQISSNQRYYKFQLIKQRRQARRALNKEYEASLLQRPHFLHSFNEGSSLPLKFRRLDK